MKNDSFAKARIGNPILISAVGIHNNTIPSRNWERSITLAFSFYQVTSDGMSKAYISEAKRFLEVIAYAEDQGADAIVKTLTDNIEDFTIELLANCYLEISRFRASKNDGADVPTCRHHMLPASVEANTFILDYPCFACEEEKVSARNRSLTRNDETLSWELSTIFYAEFSTDDQLGRNAPGPGQPVWRGLAIGAIDCMEDMEFLNDERHPMTRLAGEFDELVFHLSSALYEKHEALYPTQEGKPDEEHPIWTKTARAVVEYMKTIGLFFVAEEPEPALVLSELPDGSYYDGTYEWEKDGIYWTPLMAPSGMPSEPDPKRLRRVIKTYEAIA